MSGKTLNGRRNPPGWWTLPVEVVTDGKRIMLVGEPPTEEQDPECEAHYCDAMGCRGSHILVRMLLDDAGRLGLRHLIDAERAKDEAENAPKPLSLREQVLARLGRVREPEGSR